MEFKYNIEFLKKQPADLDVRQESGDFHEIQYSY